MELSKRLTDSQENPNVEVEAALQDEITGSGSNVGVSSYLSGITKKGEIARREDVRQLLLRLDPEGVERKKSQKLRRRIYQTLGPNYVWHINGFDKIEPYGFSIHECIGGYSRKIIWLKASTSNKCLDLRAYYYLKAAKNLNDIRGDNGREHLSISFWRFIKFR